ncbi:DUF6074 family protein [Methylobacterium sp. NEAU 140]|uniref:DUF6074 family protein n=1 Tax=Methylobacterium sp. NEAU 140 TaxID=3064945 RepID=UPI00273302DF|nr:DUF6074 family protein [Methylobacterium sp. NEAU 140]MDP4022419.1 DUF6074 family protein [Methylobacterium sp. NEAU 140]
MSDVSDLPLFSGTPAVESRPAPKKRRPREHKLVVELVPTYLDATEPPAEKATVLAFPASRDVRLVADLAQAFMALRERHGRRCRAMLLDKRFRPIGARLRKLGIPADVVQDELARLEKAVARVVWIHDGRPACGSGGGSAA